MFKDQSSKRTEVHKSALRDLSLRNADQVKAGARSDLGQKLQFQLQEANNIYS
jgi:hypothetical protein